MTPISGMLAVFASKNKEVVKIRIQVAHVDAVSTRVEFGWLNENQWRVCHLLRLHIESVTECLHWAQGSFNVIS